MKCITPYALPPPSSRKCVGGLSIPHFPPLLHFSFTHTFPQKVHIHHQLLLRIRRTRLCMRDHQAHMRSASLPAHAVCRLSAGSVFIISECTPRSLRCTGLSGPLLYPVSPPPSPSGKCGITTIRLSGFLHAVTVFHSLLRPLLIQTFIIFYFITHFSPILKSNGTSRCSG